MGQAPAGPGPEFWSSAVVARALSRCDLPVHAGQPGHVRDRQWGPGDRAPARESRDTARADEAFGLAAEALAAGRRYGSERVIERSREFRSAYTGPVTGPVRDFDRQLAALLS